MSFYHFNCNLDSRGCGSGCCTSTGACAYSLSTCTNRYSDYYTNSTKYNYPGYYHINCASTAQNCTSGCCTSSGQCAITSGTCVNRYGDYYTNSSKYAFNAYYSLNCTSTARFCTSGCCTLSGNCATSSVSCFYKYSDYDTNATKYYYSSDIFTNSTTTAVARSGDIGAIAGGVSGGVVFLIAIIAIIVGCIRRMRNHSMAGGITTSTTSTSLGFGNGGTTILMTNNAPQPVYGMNQPMNPMMNQPMNPMMNPPMNPPMQPNNPYQPYQPSYQPVPQPSFNDTTFMQAGVGLVNQPPPGPIVY